MYSPCDDCERDCNLCEYDKALQDLAAYDQAEKDGRLVILPCKIGDIVWRVCHREGDVSFIRAVKLTKNNINRIIIQKEFGRTVFATKEEAEKNWKTVDKKYPWGYNQNDKIDKQKGVVYEENYLVAGAGHGADCRMWCTGR